MTTTDPADYSAHSIRVLSDAEVGERFVFVRAARLAEQYPSVPADFITRLLTACEHSGFPEALAVQRYLDGDRTVDVTDALKEAHQAVIDDERERRERPAQAMRA